MPAITGAEVVKDAFGLLNVFMANETPDASSSQQALRLLNDMLGTWRQRTGMIPVIAPERFDLVTNQGGPANPYTIGDGGDFDTERPANQNSITAANLILTTTSPEVRVPLAIYTDDGNAANHLPSMTSGQPTGLYYNPTYANDLGSIFLWPVPDTGTNDLELFLQKYLVSFANLQTTYYVPDGVVEALKYNLARRLQTPFGRTLDAEAKQIAVSSLGVFKRSNWSKVTDLPTDATFAIYGRHAIFDIVTGQGG